MFGKSSFEPRTTVRVFDHERCAPDSGSDQNVCRIHRLVTAMIRRRFSDAHFFVTLATPKTMTAVM